MGYEWACDAHVLYQLVHLDLGQVECGGEVFGAVVCYDLADADRFVLLAERDGLRHLLCGNGRGGER